MFKFVLSEGFEGFEYFSEFFKFLLFIYLFFMVCNIQEAKNWQPLARLVSIVNQGSPSRKVKHYN